MADIDDWAAAVNEQEKISRQVGDYSNKLHAIYPWLVCLWNMCRYPVSRVDICVVCEALNM